MMSWVTLEKKIVSTTLYVFHLGGRFIKRNIYIYGYIAQLQKLQNEVAQLQKKFNFLKVSNFSFNIYFLSHEGTKTH